MRNLILIFLLTSCVSITREYNDDFRGVWQSVDNTFLPYASEVVLDISETEVGITIDGQYHGAGNYNHYESQMIIGWSVDIGRYDIMFNDAVLTIDGSLLLRWKPLGIYYPFTSLFKQSGYGESDLRD